MGVGVNESGVQNEQKLQSSLDRLNGRARTICGCKIYSKYTEPVRFLIFKTYHILLYLCNIPDLIYSI